MPKKVDEPRIKMQFSINPQLLWDVKKKALERRLNLREALVQALNTWLNTPDF